VGGSPVGVKKKVGEKVREGKGTKGDDFAPAQIL
jgi:hypothetical protein